MIEGPALSSVTGMAGQFLVARLRAYDARLGETVPRLLSGGNVEPGNDEAVHDFRVALRRTRTLLEVGRPLFGRFHADEVRSALRDVQRATGTLRDEEVLLDLLGSIESLAGDSHHRPPYAGNARAWIDSRRRRERRLRSALRRKVREGELDRGRYLLAALVAFRIKPSRDRRLTKFARRAVDEARRAVEQRRRAPMDEPEALHDLRIACKRLRYTVEVFESVLPPDLIDLAQTATRLQNRLGRLHDVDLAIGSVKGARQLLDVGRDNLLAALDRVRKERAAAVEQELSGARLGPSPIKVRHAENGAGRASSA